MDTGTKPDMDKPLLYNHVNYLLTFSNFKAPRRVGSIATAAAGEEMIGSLSSNVKIRVDAPIARMMLD